LSLITSFVITIEVILNLTSDYNLIAAYYYVAYRSPFPEQKTVERVKKELKENNIDIKQMRDWRAGNCQYGESSTEDESFA
jgi:hypothetical protein